MVMNISSNSMIKDDDENDMKQNNKSRIAATAPGSIGIL